MWLEILTNRSFQCITGFLFYVLLQVFTLVFGLKKTWLSLAALTIRKKGTNQTISLTAYNMLNTFCTLRYIFLLIHRQNILWMSKNSHIVFLPSGFMAWKMALRKKNNMFKILNRLDFLVNKSQYDFYHFCISSIKSKSITKN